MKKLVFLIFVVFTLAGTGLAAGKGPEIRIIDDKVSIQAETIPLARLLRLLDAATGMTSKVPPELANRNVSVQFSNLKFDDAVRKIFQGLPIDYVVLEGRGIIVTGSSQTTVAENGAAPYVPPAPEAPMVEDNAPFVPQPPIVNNNPPFNNPNVPGNPNNPNNPNQRPAMIQTPFGPIPDPRANQGGQQNGVAPMVTPGQVAPTNPFNSTLPGFNGNGTLPALQTNPFGTTTPSYPTNSPTMSPGITPTSPFPTITPQTRPNP